MSWQPINKNLKQSPVVPNLQDYELAVKDFSWRRARSELSGLPGNHGLNIAYEAVDRHALGQRAGQTAFRWFGKDGAVRDITYGSLASLSNRFANVLARLGIIAGDRVFVLAGRIAYLRGERIQKVEST